jgi:hypothetical protein
MDRAKVTFRFSSLEYGCKSRQTDVKFTLAKNCESPRDAAARLRWLWRIFDTTVLKRVVVFVLAFGAYQPAHSQKPSAVFAEAQQHITDVEDTWDGPVRRGDGDRRVRYESVLWAWRRQ